jgi:hypothetical protein
MKELRISFRDHTQFVVAREFMFGVAVGGRIPSDRSVEETRQVSRRKVAEHRDHVKEVADHIFAAMRLEWQAEREQRRAEWEAMQELGRRLV